MNWKSGIFLLCAALITLGVVFFLPEPTASPPTESPPPVAVLPEPRDTDDTVGGFLSTTTPEGRVAAATTSAATYVTEATFYQELEYLNTLVTALARPAIPQAGILMLLAKLQGQVTDLEEDIERTSTRDARQDDEDRASSRDSVSELTDDLTTAVTTETLAVSGAGTVTGSLTSGSLATTDASFGGPLTLSSIASPAVTSNKLYNVSGDLYWAGSIVGGSTVGTWTTDGTNVWRAGGNVGIGTSTPTYNFHVVNGSGTALMGLESTSGNVRFDLKTADGNFFALQRSTGTNDLRFQYNGETKMQIVGETGNVSIGSVLTSSGGARLTVMGSSTSATESAFRVNSPISNLFEILNNGNVGIGTSTPQYKLDVRGDLVGFNIDTPIHITSDARYMGMFVDATLAGGMGQSNIFFGKNGTKSFQLGSDLNQNGTKDFFLWDSTSAATRLYIGSTGNVGIGTTTPTSLFAIEGGSARSTISAIGGTYPSMQFVRVGQSTWELGMSGTNPVGGNGFRIYNVTNNRAPFIIADSALDNSLVIGSTGNVGIGTTSPNAKFEVLKTGSSYQQAAAFYNTTADGLPYITVGKSVATDAGMNIGYSNTGNYGAFWITGDNPTAGGGLVLGNGGNVGIGTTAPSSALHVVGRLAVGPGAGGNTANTAGTLDLWSTNGSGSMVAFTEAGSGNRGLIGFGAGSNDMVFRVNGAQTFATGLEAMRISQTGNVGIGDASPAALLTVGSGDLFQVDNTGVVKAPFIKVHSANPSLQLLEVDNTYGFTLRQNGVSNYFELLRHNNDATGVTVLEIGRSDGSFNFNSGDVYFTSSGNVGIGTTTPSAKLSVLGTTFLNTSSGNNFITLDGSGRTDYASVISWAGSAGIFSLNAGTNNYRGFQLFYTDDGTYKYGIEGNVFTGLKLYGGSATPYITVLDVHSSTPGNVGIGTTSPGSRLSVSGGVSIGANYTTAAPTNGLMVEGKVNIGTTTPSNPDHPLEIQHNSALWRFAEDSKSLSYYVANTGVRGWSLSGQGFANSAGLTNWLEFDSGRTMIGTDGDSGSNSLYLATNNVRRFTVLYSNGNVGIGTTTPTQKLSVVGNAVFTTADNYTGNVLVQSPGNPSRDYLKLITNAYNQYFDYGGANSATTFRANDGSVNTLHLSSTGNVGIGTTSPSTRFHIYSTTDSELARFERGNSSGSAGTTFWHGGAQRGAIGTGAFVVSGGDNTDFGLQTNGNLVFGAGGTTERMRISSTGNVGIGTTSPQGKLHVASGNSGTTPFSAGDELVVEGSGATGMTILSGTGSTGNIYFGSPVNNTRGLIQYDHSSDFMRFQVAQAERMRITSTGNVGIGTTVPGTKLHIAADYGATGNAFTIENTNVTNPQYYTFGFNSSFGGGKQLMINGSGSGVAGVNFGSSNFISVGSGNVTFTSGNVGIGTTAPGTRLQVVGGGATIPALGTNGGTLLISNNDANYGLLAGVESNGNSWLQVQRVAGGATAYNLLLQPNGGNVGIGTTTPSTFKLQVAGNVGPDADNTYTLGGVGNDWECVYYEGGSLGTCASDQRLKENVAVLSYTDENGTALEKLSALDLHTFTFTSAPGSTYKGLIAQEVLAIAPELVTLSDDGFYAVKYGDLQWLTIEALQELTARLDSLELMAASFSASTTDHDTSFWERISELAASFIDGVLKLASAEIEYVKAEVVDAVDVNAERLCLGNVCVTEAEFREVFGEGAGEREQEDQGETDDSEEAEDSDVNDDVAAGDDDTTAGDNNADASNGDDDATTDDGNGLGAVGDGETTPPIDPQDDADATNDDADNDSADSAPVDPPADPAPEAPADMPVL